MRRLIGRVVTAGAVLALFVGVVAVGREVVRVRADMLTAAEQWTRAQGVTGAIIAVDRPVFGRTVVAAGRSDQDTALDPRARFRIGSITKMFTAAVVLRLAADGLIGLDDPIGKYGVGPSWAAPVTVRQLLSMRSGIPEYENEAFYGYLASDLTQPVDPADLVARFAGSGLKFSPGTRYEYSSTNSLLAGLLVERVTRRPYAEVLRSRVLEPLGLGDTSLPIEDVPGMAAGYSRRHAARFGVPVVHTQRVRAPAIAAAAWTSGAMVSTAEDLLAWSSALFGGKILPEPYLRQMLTFDDAFGDYGLGVQRQRTQHGVAYGHGGVYFGYLAQMIHLPASQTTVVVLANDDAADIGGLARTGARVALGGATVAPVEELAARLRDQRADVRRQAALDLGLVPAPTAHVTDVLRVALADDPAPEVRAAAALALGLAGHVDLERVEAALQSARERDPSVREAAGVALGALRQRLGR